MGSSIYLFAPSFSTVFATLVLQYILLQTAAIRITRVRTTSREVNIA